MSDFASRLRELRLMQGLSTLDLANACGIPREKQRGYELGMLKPNRRYLQALANAGLEVAYLTTGEFPAPQPGGMDQPTYALLDNFKHSSREAQLDVLVGLMIAAAPNRERHAQVAAQQRFERQREAVNDAHA